MDRLGLIYSCAQDIWRPHLGDPTNGGLAMTVLYAVASLLLLRTALSRDGWLRRERLLWGISAALLLLMTANKQLDLQKTVIWVGRCVAKKEGWFDQRLAFQRGFGMVVMTLLALVVVALGWTCRRVLEPNWPLILGTVLLTGFVVLQVARFEQLAGGLGQAVVALSLHRILEGTALCVLVWSTLRRRPLWG